jgi:RHS repeat-associated protein
MLPRIGPAGQVSSVNDGEGTDTISFNPAGLPTSETDSQAGTFTATYNADGNLATTTYPGGVTATYGYDETGTATALSYAGADWTAPLTNSVTPDAFGDWTDQTIADTATSLASNQAYAYDNDNRQTAVQDTESGQCTTRTYTYNASSDRTSLATAAPGSGGACTTASPTTETYTYDPADRHTSIGYSFDTQGDITTTPSEDSDSGGNLTATYYANNMLASQTQGGQTTTWTLDPTNQPFGSYTEYGTTYTAHYASPASSNPTWYQSSTGSWNRAVQGPDGLLAATVTGSGVTLQLVDLHGDILATSSTSPSATGPSATYVYTEFGTPEQGSPGMYGWLGGYGVSSAALGNDVLMGARSYSTSTGRFDQVDPIPGGNANAYDYVFQNPLTNYDLTGMKCGSWGHVSYSAYAISVDFNSCAAIDVFAVLGGLGGFATWLFVSVLPLDWPVAVAIAAAVGGVSALLAAWGGICDLFDNGPRLTMSFTNHADRKYSYEGRFYPTAGCW